MSGAPTAVVFCGGDAPLRSELLAVHPEALIIAADRGLDHTRGAGITPSAVVGDMDSVSPEGLEWARTHGVGISEYPAEKDATDFELAMETAHTAVTHRDVADRSGTPAIHVLGLTGGRIDHFLGNLAVLADPRWSGARVSGSGGGTHFTVVRGGECRLLHGVAGQALSLLAFGADVEGVRTAGLRYPLHGETLRCFGSRGISNVFAEHEAKVSVVAGGVLIAVQPEHYS